jgi:two-component system sensor histidine kinase DegS
VSAETPALLDEAQQLVAEQLARLRALLETGSQRQAQLLVAQRQAERALDEAIIQHRFARERRHPEAEALRQREATLRAQHEAVSAERQAADFAVRQLDQLVRQIDMSSSALIGGAEGFASDPWVLALRAQVISGREEERARLAREVHDGPAQVLANTLMGLEQCANLLRAGNAEKLETLIDRLRAVTREGLHEVRRFIADLRPGKLDEQGLVAALHDYIGRHQNSVGASVTFESDSLPRLRPEAEIVLYRVVQEALQNAHKHARGAAVRVTINVRGDLLHLTVRDDGPGFDPREVARRAGRESWGLTSMRERAELIGAKLTVSARPDHGTEVAVTLPLS